MFKARDDVTYRHVLAETWKGPFADRQKYFGDPDFVDVPLAALMTPKRLATRAALISANKTTAPARYELPIEPPVKVQQSDNAGTAHLCAVDKEGNVASVTTTVNLPFGARYTADGIIMNDEMDDFATAVGEVNAFGLVGGARNLPEPGKRPVSTMSPTIIFDDFGPVLCIGASGGSRIVTATEQVALDVLLHKKPLKDAISAPRIHHQGVPNELRVEKFAPVPPKVVDRLKARGHVVTPINNVANVQAIQIHRNGTVTAACDPRKGGLPAGSDPLK